MTHRLRVITVYILVMLLAVLLSGFIYVNDQRLQNTTEQLFSNSLPLLRHINELRTAKVEHERLIYEYYATTDRPRLLPAIEHQQSRLQQLLQKIKQKPLPMQEDLHKSHLTLVENAQAIDDNLKQDQIDWDQARSQLMTLSHTGRSIDPYLDLMTESIEAQAQHDSMASQDRIQLGTRLVISFCLAISALALLVGFFVDRYLRETAERKRLAMFAERNPNPVLSIGLDLSIRYCNPAAQRLTLQLDIENSDLLPTDLNKIIADGTQQDQGTLNLQQRTFSFTWSRLSDLEIGHLYLEDISEQRRAEQQLEHQAKYDRLTQLPNRQQLEDSIETQLAGDPKAFHLVLLNLHQFSRITASYGYRFGDKLLQRVSERLQHELRSEQLLAPGLCRIDGRNFAFILPPHPDLKAEEQIHQLGQRLIGCMQEPITLDDNELHLSLCIGASQAPFDHDQVSGLLKCADAALMQSKKSDGHNLTLYSQKLHQRHAELLQLENEMRVAIKNQSFELYYQPKLSVNNNRIECCEALMRWIKDGKPHHSPAEFIPIAEQSGLIIPLGYWALENAFAQAQAWRESTPVITAINLSLRQFQHHDFISSLKRLRHQYTGIEAFIEFEITESLLMQDIEHSIGVMQAIKDMGFALSIDDFGTGYSSLSYLKDFPIDKLKVDRSFIMNMTTNNEDKMLVETIIKLAHSLGLTTVAEGVETEEQLQQLTTLECEEIQGYFISRPLPANAFNQFMQQGSSTA